MESNPRGKINGQKTASTNYKTSPLLQSACKPFLGYHCRTRQDSWKIHVKQKKEGKQPP